MESDLPSLWVQRGGASGAVRRERPQNWGSLKRSTHPDDPASSRMFPFFFFFFKYSLMHLAVPPGLPAALGIFLRADSQLQPAGSSSLT